jgi:ribonucleotide monophosphatase NagD (HAD superfamily)
MAAARLNLDPPLPRVRHLQVPRCRASPSRSSKFPALTVDWPILTFSSIDGVLLRSSSTVPGATKALRYLHDHHIPFILLTNGGGKHEGERVQELSKRFEVPLTVENFVQSHTPFQEMAHGSDNYEALKDKTVLVTGGDQDQCRKIAEM